MSAAAVGQLPEAECEVALVGRSNVGKSTLLNALANRKGLAKTSKTPGATRLLNVFALSDARERWIVDLPGYGYAKVSANERVRWERMIEGYLTERETVLAALHLIDGAVGPTKSDLATRDWLAHHGLDIHFVATKDDKVKPSKRRKRRDALSQALGVRRGDVHWVSAAKGQGIPELRAHVLHILDGSLDAEI